MCGDLEEEDRFEGDLYQRFLVLARLAGFLAGHVALNEDPLRKLMAVMLSCAEAESPPVHDHHGHDHDHDHDHVPRHDH